jgi:hypothetical protein
MGRLTSAKIAGALDRRNAATGSERNNDRFKIWARLTIPQSELGFKQG